ncbi:MAG: sulfatase family protein [Jejuia sp.]
MVRYVFTVVFFVLCYKSFSQNKPNVIVVLADDIGTGDVSYYRNLVSKDIVVETPTLDKLCAEGMVFTDAHSPAALCAPTRYAIMTGNHCYRSYAPWGVWGSYQQSPIEDNQLTLGKLMKNAGYTTSFFGKWGFGMDFAEKDDASKVYRSARKQHEIDVDITKVIDKGPIQNGFDYSFMYPAGIQAEPYAVYENGIMMPLKEDSEIVLMTNERTKKMGFKLDKKEGLGDSNWNAFNAGSLLANKAVDFIKRTTNNNESFFMYYCSQAVHKPHTPSKVLNGKPIAGTTPSNHLDMVKELDVQMEMLIQTLKEQGVYDNTLFIFTSDNGGLQVSETLKSGHNSSGIYRGSKNQCYEGGTRVPFIAWWPGKIKAGTISDEPILGIDVMATLADITNQSIPENQAKDSASLFELFKDGSAKVHDFLITQSGTGKQGMITKDGWKLIIQFDKKDQSYSTMKPMALFNLRENITENESANLITDNAYKNKVDELFTLYKTTRNSNLPTVKR